MNTLLHARLDALEAALTALTDSVTAYSPSAAAARDVVAADDALAVALDTLAAHQRNHRQIQRLRATSAALDARFADALRGLAGARKTLVDVPLAPPAPVRDGPRAVAHADVLALARHAVRFRSPARLAERDRGAGAGVSQQEQQDGTAAAAAEEETRNNPGLRALSGAERAWLDPADGRGGSLAGLAELPWPTEDQVARSGLARSQGWARAIYDDDDGPGGAEGAQGPAAAGPGAEADGTGDTEMAEAGGAGARAGQMARPPRPPEPEKRVFTGMELYDPDED